MTLNFLLDEPNSPELRLERSLLTGRNRLYANERELIKEPKKGLFDQVQVFTVLMPDGTHRQLSLKNIVYDTVPEVKVDGQPLVLAKPLQVWEYIVAALPLLLVFSGGILGGGVGGFAAYTNIGIMRSERSLPTRVLLCLGALVLAMLAYGLLAWLLFGALAV
ncbi:hypothetical protein D0N36_08820 [Hymenobacter lapidiphilus]|uniref:hypothetical protein n=1 Tax=Hymenobacter sp. CCM 8763 TaxID=2303334 RepID=UPI000E3510A9|nr:hypothetical protein [Hymenobacter sp. CCM 8763]RFP65367.1 hypothetical protein D0N36_08820 [Hymenobacter sp. CCM 8763]